MADDERLLSVVLRFLLDGQSLAQVQAGTKSVADALATARSEAQALRREGRELGQVGSILTLAGGALTAGISAAAALYIKNTKESTATTVAWKDATDSVAASTQRIGAVAAQVVLPFLQDAAKLAAQVADFAEKNPQVIQTIFDIGKIVLGIGAFVKVASEGIKFVADIKLLALGSQQQAAAAQMVASGQSHNAAAETMVQASIGMQTAAETMAANGINKFGGVGTGQYGPASLPMAPSGDTSINSMGGVGNQAYGPEMAAAGGAVAAGGTTLAGVAAALAPMVAVTAAILAVGKTFEMLNTEVIQPAQNLTDVMHKHADSMVLTASNYKEYQTEIDRTNSLYGTYRDVAGQVHTVVKALTQDEFDQARAEAGQAKAAQDATTAAKDLTDNMVLFGFSVDDLKTRVGNATALFKGMGTIGTGTQAGSDLLNQAQGTLAAQSPGVKAYIAYQKQLDALQTTYNANRLAAVNAANTAEVNAMIARDTTLESLADSFNKTSVDSAQKFALQRTDEQAKLNDELAKMAEAHATEMARLEQDHGIAIRKLGNSRDALGLADENEKYNLEVQRKEQDYATQVADRQHQLAVTLADQKQAFDLQRQQQIDQYNQQVADAQAKYKADTDMAEIDKSLKITALDNALTEQRRLLNSSFSDQLFDLGYAQAAQRNAYLAYYAQQNQDFNDYITANKAIWQSALPGFNNSQPSTGSPVPGHGAAGGGYVSGMVRTGENGPEWVMDNPTMRAAEQMLGGRLSQDRILAAMAGHGGGGGGLAVSLSMTNNFGGVSQPGQILDLIDARAYDAVIRAANEAKQIMRHG